MSQFLFLKHRWRWQQLSFNTVSITASSSCQDFYCSHVLWETSQAAEAFQNAEFSSLHLRRTGEVWKTEKFWMWTPFDHNFYRIFDHLKLQNLFISSHWWLLFTSLRCRGDCLARRQWVATALLVVGSPTMPAASGGTQLTCGGHVLKKHGCNKQRCWNTCLSDASCWKFVASDLLSNSHRDSYKKLWLVGQRMSAMQIAVLLWVWLWYLGLRTFMDFSWEFTILLF